MFIFGKQVVYLNLQDYRSNTSSDGQLRELQEKFLLNVALRTITRPFGAAFLNYHSLQAEPMEMALVDRICLNGRIRPSDKCLEYPAPEPAAPAKLVSSRRTQRSLYLCQDKKIHSSNGTKTKFYFRVLAGIHNCATSRRLHCSAQAKAKAPDFGQK